MGITFIACPAIKIAPVNYQYYESLQKSKAHDWKSFASEMYAFEYLGIHNFIVREDELIKKYSQLGIKTPECIAFDPNDSSKIISIEVKRICGNRLPCDYTGQKHRYMKYRNKIIWPWGKTVKTAFEKAHSNIVSDLGINTHHAVFVIPNSLTKRASRRLCERIEAYTKAYGSYTTVRNLIVHVIQGDDAMFDRL